MVSCTVEFSESGLLKLDKKTYEQIGLRISQRMGLESTAHIVTGQSNCPVCTGNLIHSHQYRKTGDGSEVYVGPDSDQHHTGEPASEYWRDIVMHGASGKVYSVGDYQGESHPLAAEMCRARNEPIDYPKETVNTVIGNRRPSRLLLNVTDSVVKEILG